MDKDNRNYNVYFNTHTVTGIVISIGLFVCFFAGCFALFKDNINRWESNEAPLQYQTDIDYERILAAVENEGYSLDGRNYTIQYNTTPVPHVNVRSQPLPTPKDTAHSDLKLSALEQLAQPINLNIDPVTYEQSALSTDTSASQLGTFLNQLHFFAQIPGVGMMLASLVSLFFLFAIVTGVIVHWKKIISNFFTFRLKSSIKNLWTDAHTALGIIGLPFQFMYALTGAFFGLIILIFIPYTFVLFGGDFNKTAGYLSPSFKSYESAGESVLERKNINGLVDNTLAELGKPNIERVRVNLFNYNDKNAHLLVEVRVADHTLFYNVAINIYRRTDGKLVYQKNLEDASYVENVAETVSKLHFAKYGGYFMKAIYFILALITCFVIISGVMVWLVAREKKTYAHKAKFNLNVGAIYIGTCVGLYPAIALFFCLVKVFPPEIDGRFGIMSNIFFLFWLTFIIYAYFIKNTFRISRQALILAGGLGLLAPILNGLQSGLWPWKSLNAGYVDSFSVDVSWIVMSVITLLATWKARPVGKKRKSKEVIKENPQDISESVVLGKPVFNLNATPGK